MTPEPDATSAVEAPATRHTPGPWHLLLADDGAFEVRSAPAPEELAGSMVIAKRTIGPPDPAEGRANARLIVSAPELLAALKGCVAGLRGERYELSLLREADAAIAKAEGR